MEQGQALKTYPSRCYGKAQTNLLANPVLDSPWVICSSKVFPKPSGERDIWRKRIVWSNVKNGHSVQGGNLMKDIWCLLVKNTPVSAGLVKDVGLIPGSGRSPGGGHGNPLQASCLENIFSLWTEEPGDLHGARGVHGVAKIRTWLKWLSREHWWPDTRLGRKWVLMECDWLRNEEICLHLLALILSMEDVWLCDPMDCSSPGSSVHGVSQARILEWVAISFSRGSSWPRDQTRISCVSCTDRWILYQLSHWLEGYGRWNSGH